MTSCNSPTVFVIDDDMNVRAQVMGDRVGKRLQFND
jgi:hypothetical protein